MRKQKYTKFEMWDEVHSPIETIYEKDQGFELYLQKGVFHYPSGITEIGYRFIRRKPNGKLQLALNQACIPSLSMARELIDEAQKVGWGNELTPEERYSGGGN